MKSKEVIPQIFSFLLLRIGTEDVANSLQGLPPSRLGKSAIPPSPQVRVPTESPLQVHEPRLPRPLGLPSHRRRGAMSALLSRPEWLNGTRCVTRLTLSRTTGLRYSGLELLLQACPRLEAVDVPYCWGYGDREASAISCAKGLRELRMDKCLGVTDVGLAKIAVGCGRLERLSLKWCTEIYDLGVDLLCKKCLDLKSLDVSYLKA